MALVSFATLLGSCGDISLGGNPYLLEAVPDGTLVYQGVFTSLSSSFPVSGTAEVYRSTSGDTLRVASLSAPTSVGSLSLIGQGQQSGSTRTHTTTLRSARGNQNYETGVTGVVWSSVSVRAASSPTAQPYGTALLQAVSSR